MNNTNIDPKHSALVIIDVQNDYCHEDGVKAQQGADLTQAQQAVSVIESLIEPCRERGIPIVFVYNTNSDDTLSEALLNRPGGSARSAVVRKGTWGAQLYRFDPQPQDIVLEKHRYSAFIGTDFDDQLKQMGIKSLLITGLATNVCVECTARDAFMLDYYVTLIKDGCSGYNPELEAATYANAEKHFGTVMNSSQLLKLWNS